MAREQLGPAPSGSTDAVTKAYVDEKSICVNVKDHGAKGDGTTDDTAAIESAWAACVGNKHNIFFPPGTYVYSGAGLDGLEAFGTGLVMHAKGSGEFVTTIKLGTSSYFFKPSNWIGSLLLEDIRFEGGKGAVKHTHTGVDTIGTKHISRCRFDLYTECAIATDAGDSPFWFISECLFTSANTTSTIGIAMAVGLTDSCTITKCNFQRNRVHIKAGDGGNNLYITENGFYQASPVNSSGPRSFIWIVPTSGSTNNAGNGLAIQHNKFGAEFLRTGDHTILYADQGSGASNGAKMPVLDADSTGIIMGHTISENFVRRGAIFGVDSTNLDIYYPSLIYSTTPNVLDLAVSDNQIFDNINYLLEYRTPPTVTVPGASTSRNYFGPVIGWSEGAIGPKVSNDPAAGYTHDPLQVLQMRSNVLRQNSSGSSPSYASLTSAAITTFSAYNATSVGTTDAYGGSDAVTLTVTGDAGGLTTTLSSFVPGKPVWVEIDVAHPSSGTALTSLRLGIFNADNTAHWMRYVEVPSSATGWMTYAFSFIPRNTGSGMWFFVNTASTETGIVSLGRPRIYQSHERVLGGRRPTITGSRASGAALTSLLSSLVEQGLIIDGTTA